jgi:hypothetical protein
MTTQAQLTNFVRCSRCSRAWPLHAWRALPKQRTLTRADLTGYVSAWPADVVVEVRTCGGCGAAIARRAGDGSYRGP